MTVCKYFLEGRCRYGERCRFDHPRGPPNQQGAQRQLFSGGGGVGGGGGGQRVTFRDSFGASQNTSQYKWTAQDNKQQTGASGGDIITILQREIETWEQSKQWPFSCLSIEKDLPCLPELEDLSPEELRFEAYEAMKSGSIQTYITKVQQLTLEYSNKRTMLKSPSMEIKQKLIMFIEEHKKNKSSGIKQSSFGGGSSAFGGGTSSEQGSFGARSSGIFGSSGQSTASSFGQSSSANSIFGGGTSGSASAFGSNSGSGMFGQSKPSTFGSGSATSVFGGNSSGSAGSAFGGGSSFNSVGAGGATGSASPSSVFGGSGTAGGGFGSTGSAPPGGVFGTGATSSGFGVSGTTTAFGGTGSVFGGTQGGFGHQTAVNSSSGFGVGSGDFAVTPVVPSGSGIASPASTTNAFGGGSAFAAPVASTVNKPPSGFFSNQGQAAVSAAAPKPASAPAPTNSKTYTPMGDLTEEEKAQFNASMFVLGKVPTRPPAVEYINGVNITT